jgi:hypothetical protein
LQKNYDSWKKVYIEQKNDIEINFKKIVYNFDSSNKYDIEWDNFKSQVKYYMKIHETNGWEI